MGIIREPYGIDFVIDSSSMTDADREKIGELIAKRKAVQNTKSLPNKVKSNSTLIEKKRIIKSPKNKV
jgi:hypothetical protein